MRVGLLVVAVAACLVLPTAAQAASVAYVDGGAIWLSNLDGSRKVMLADATSDPVDAGEFREVTAADNGRIVGVRRPPDRGGQYSWFQVWEPDGTSTKQGALGKTGSWLTYAYPITLDITSDGEVLTYGYSNASGCCPINFASGSYVMAIAAAGAEPFNISGELDPSFVGRRIVSTRDDNITYLQTPDNAPFAYDFMQWSDAFTGARASGYEMGRTDIAATGTLAAGEFIKWEPNSSNRVDGGILVYSIASPGGALTDTIKCDLPQQGIASNASISQDGTMIAWQDDGGVKVAGVPTGQDANSICTLGSAPVVISPTGTVPSIGGADVNVVRPPPAPPGGGTTPGTGTPGTTPNTPGVPGATAAPKLVVPARVTSKALAKGITLTLTVGAPGKVTLTATVPAKRLGKRGKPIVVATGTATATAAGKLKVKLRLNKTGRKNLKRLKGARLTVTARQGGKTTTTSFLVRR